MPRKQLKVRAMLQRSRFVLAYIVLVFSFGCGRSDESAPQAESQHAAIDQDVHITAEAQHAIQLKTTKVQASSVADAVEATGWIVARPPAEVIVKAPTTGFVQVANDAPFAVGSFVKKDERIAAIRVFLAPHEQSQIASERADTQTLIDQSQAIANTAEEQLKRIESTAAGAVTGARIAELRESIVRARAAEKHAREKLQYMNGASGGNDKQLSEVPVTAPVGGRLMNVHFAPQQLVVQGDPLWTIADWSRLWVQVSAFPADVIRVDRRASASISLLGGKQSYTAKPVNAAQSVDPGKQTVVLLYEIENRDDQLRPGQAVSVSLPLEQKGPALSVPSGAILWDGMGNSWVYLKTGASSYRRRKVELARVRDGNAIVARGLKVGEEVVTAGAESLYGEEFKDQIPAGDND